MQALRRTRREEVFSGLAAMNRGPIPDHEQLAAYRPEQLGQEGHNRRPTECLRLDESEEATMRPPGIRTGPWKPTVKASLVAHTGVNPGIVAFSVRSIGTFPPTERGRRSG